MTDAGQEPHEGAGRHSVAAQPPSVVGERIYVARAWSYGDRKVPCPVCYGKLFAVLELGNGERVQVECDGCGLGFEGPQGVVNEPCAGSRVEALTVTGFRLHDERWRILTLHGEVQWGVEAFATEAEAETRRLVLFEEAVKDAEDRSRNMADYKRRKVTWLVRYHRDCLKKAQRDAEYHQRKLSDALARQRKARTDEAVAVARGEADTRPEVPSASPSLGTPK